MYKQKVIFIVVTAVFLIVLGCDNPKSEKNDISSIGKGRKTYTPKDKGKKQKKTSIYKYTPKDKEALVIAIKKEIKAQGNNANLNTIDTSAIIDMSYLFAKDQEHSPRKEGYDLQDFRGDISQWSVSNVTTMHAMFWDDAFFNSDISEWNVSRVTDMAYMFYGATTFNKNISRWKVFRVTKMYDMFSDAAAFNRDISGWDVSRVTDMGFMFARARAFNKNLEKWKIKRNVNVGSMFHGSGVKSLPTWCERPRPC